MPLAPTLNSFEAVRIAPTDYLDGCPEQQRGAIQNPQNMPTQPTFSRLLTVIVVYERDLDEVQAWPFLRQRLRAAGRGSANEDHGFLLDRVLIYDNSLTARAQPVEYHPGCIYVHDSSNGGTAAAYACACTTAREAGIDWLLLLDQDTSLPCGFLEAASAGLTGSLVQPSALVPWVFHGTSVVSPARVTDAGTIVPLQYQAPPPIARGLTAVSSGSLLHVPTLAAHMPIPDGLWLDFVDHWIFWQLRSHGLPVMVFDASLQHDLSICKLESLNLRRLTSILNGEASFLALLGTKARLVYPFRLAARVLRYATIRPELATHMLAWIVHRVRSHI